jgi:copper chaperone
MLSFQVEGMSCGHCRSAVTAAVRKVAPEAKVDVDLETGRVTVEGAVERPAIAAAIQAAGYETK